MPFVQTRHGRGRRIRTQVFTLTNDCSSVISYTSSAPSAVSDDKDTFKTVRKDLHVLMSKYLRRDNRWGQAHGIFPARPYPIARAAPTGGSERVSSEATSAHQTVP